MECLTRYYQSHAAEFLANNGVHDFMRYADSKLKEEEERGLRYLETSGDSLKKVRGRGEGSSGRGFVRERVRPGEG